MRSRRIIVAGLFGLLMAGAASAGEPTECDRLAGSPTDPNRVGAGIGLYGIEPAEAIAACETALAADPRNRREILGEIETTATFKSKKQDLTREGYDPVVTADAIYFNDRVSRSFVKVDAMLYEQLRTGNVRL